MRNKKGNKEVSPFTQTIYVLLFIELFLIISVFFCIIGIKLASNYNEKKANAITADIGEDNERLTIIIDAGHGGEDGGTIGKNGVYEKDLNLVISLTLRDMLENAGFNVVMTRDEDILLYDKNSDYKGHKKQQDLASRLNIAVNNPKAVFVSIHMNAFTESKYSGLQVYYSKNNPESYELASLIQNQVSDIIQPYNVRKAKAAGSNIYLLDRMQNCSVLVECGFLSNEAECERLCNEGYRQQLTFVLFKAITEHIELYYNYNGK